jgi:hypothetical protein
VVQVEGDEVKRFHLILTGEVELRRNDKMAGRSGVGTTIGDVELLCGTPAMRSAMGASQVRAMVLDRRQFTAVLDDCPVFRDAIVRSLARGLAAAMPGRGDGELVVGPWRPRPAPVPPAIETSLTHPSRGLRTMPAILSPTPPIGA